MNYLAVVFSKVENDFAYVQVDGIEDEFMNPGDVAIAIINNLEPDERLINFWPLWSSNIDHIMDQEERRHRTNM